MKAFKSRGVIVFVEAKSDQIMSTPKIAMETLTRKLKGPLPKLAAISADTTTSIQAFTYKQLSGAEKKCARKLSSTLRDLNPITGKSYKAAKEDKPKKKSKIYP